MFRFLNPTRPSAFSRLLYLLPLLAYLGAIAHAADPDHTDEHAECEICLSIDRTADSLSVTAEQLAPDFTGLKLQPEVQSSLSYVSFSLITCRGPPQYT